MKYKIEIGYEKLLFDNVDDAMAAFKVLSKATLADTMWAKDEVIYFKKQCGITLNAVDVKVILSDYDAALDVKNTVDGED